MGRRSQFQTPSGSQSGSGISAMMTHPGAVLPWLDRNAPSPASKPLPRAAVEYFPRGIVQAQPPSSGSGRAGPVWAAGRRQYLRMQETESGSMSTSLAHLKLLKDDTIHFIWNGS